VQNEGQKFQNFRKKGEQYGTSDCAKKGVTQTGRTLPEMKNQWRPPSSGSSLDASETSSSSGSSIDTLTISSSPPFPKAYTPEESLQGLSPPRASSRHEFEGRETPVKPSPMASMTNEQLFGPEFNTYYEWFDRHHGTNRAAQKAETISSTGTSLVDQKSARKPKSDGGSCIGCVADKKNEIANKTGTNSSKTVDNEKMECRIPEGARALVSRSLKSKPDVRKPSPVKGPERSAQSMASSPVKSKSQQLAAKEKPHCKKEKTNHYREVKVTVHQPVVFQGDESISTNFLSDNGTKHDKVGTDRRPRKRFEKLDVGDQQETVWETASEARGEGNNQSLISSDSTGDYWGCGV
jgi:hypothetical protein